MKKTIKRLLSAALCAVMLFSTVPFLNVESNAAGTKFESAYTKEQIAGYRKKLYNYMKDMATIEWTASKNYDYLTGFNRLEIKKGWKMLGIPYKNWDSVTDLKDMKSKLKEKDGEYTLGEELGHNDCSTAVALSYNNVISDFRTRGCSQHRFYPWEYKDFVPVGDYKIGKSVASTKKIDGNKSLIYKAYGMLKKGDVLVSGGHAMMVVSVNTTEKKVKVIDQMHAAFHFYTISKDEKGNKKYTTHYYKNVKGSRRSTWGIDRKISYDKLWENNFLPVRYYRFKNETTAPTINISAIGNPKGAIISVKTTTLQNVQKVFLVVSTNKKAINKDLSYRDYRDAADKAGYMIKLKDNKDTPQSQGSFTCKYTKGAMNNTYYYKIVFKMLKGNTATYISSDMGTFHTSLTDDAASAIADAADALWQNLSSTKKESTTKKTTAPKTTTPKTTAPQTKTELPTAKTTTTTEPVNTPYSDWSSWSLWSVKPAEPSDTVDVETMQAYMYYHYCNANGDCSPVKSEDCNEGHCTYFSTPGKATKTIDGQTYDYRKASKPCSNGCTEYYFYKAPVTLYRYRTREVIG